MVNHYTSSNYHKSETKVLHICGRAAQCLHDPHFNPVQNKCCVQMVQISAPEIQSSGSRALLVFSTRWLIAFTCHPSSESTPDHKHTMKIVLAEKKPCSTPSSVGWMCTAIKVLVSSFYFINVKSLHAKFHLTSCL